MELPKKPKVSRLATALIATVIISMLVGGIFAYAISNFTVSSQIGDLQNRISTLENQVSSLQSTTNVSSQIGDLQNRISTLENQVSSLQSTTNVSSQIGDLQNRISTLENQVLGENFSLPQLYEQVKSSVVMVQGIVVQYWYGLPYYSGVEGSGFVSNLTGQFVVITNYHVVQDAINITVTFTDGNTYAANVTGSDPYEDLAVLSVNAPEYEYKPLRIASSSTLEVGDPVIAVGNPLGYIGSMTSGIVSALGRTVSVSWSNYDIADCIQMTAPINPGNSGGPLMNYQGEVVGITAYTALTDQGVAAQGLGLAIPSSTILRETQSLITNGSYNSHPWLGASGTDMTYGIAQAVNTSVTYGWLIAQVTNGGPADKAGLKGGTTQVQIAGSTVTIGGDIILAINGTRIKGQDDLSSYLEEYTLPGQTISMGLVRNNENLTLSVKLGVRP